MKQRRKWIIRVLTAVGVLAALGGGLFYFQIYRPIRDFRELKTSDERIVREAAHKVLRWVPDHDALVVLCDIADESSIPVLIRSLGRVPFPNNKGETDCTTEHCFQALRKASGRYLESDVETWQNWYQQHRNQGSPPLTMKEEAAALITEEYVRKYVRPLCDPVALEAHHTADFDHNVLDANHITTIEVIPRHGKPKTVYKDESKRPVNDGMVTGVPNAQHIGFYYPASSDQPNVEVRMNYDCDAFGHIAVHVVVPNPLVIAKRQTDADKAVEATPLRSVPHLERSPKK